MVSKTFRVATNTLGCVNCNEFSFWNRPKMSSNSQFCLWFISMIKQKLKTVRSIFLCNAATSEKLNDKKTKTALMLFDAPSPRNICQKTLASSKSSLLCKIYLKCKRHSDWVLYRIFSKCENTSGLYKWRYNWAITIPTDIHFTRFWKIFQESKLYSGVVSLSSEEDILNKNQLVFRDQQTKINPLVENLRSSWQPNVHILWPYKSFWQCHPSIFHSKNAGIAE